MRDADFSELLDLAGRHRLLGAVAEVVASRELPVTDEQRALLAEHHVRWMTQALRVERLLLRIDECLSREGVETRVLKGVALAHHVYPDPAWRVFSDLDLLVASRQFDAATRVARDELNGTQPVPELRPGFDREFGKEALVRVDGVELDLHRTFVAGPFGLTVDLERLFDDSTPFHVGGRRFQALGPNAMFLHACYNAALGDYPLRLCALRDLLVVHESLTIDHDSIVAMAQDWRATAVVQRAAEITVDALELGESHSLAPLAALKVDRGEARLLRSYLTPARSYRRQLASLAVIPGVRARLRYARALVRPSREYLRSRGWDERGHVRRALDGLRGHRRD